MTAYASVPKIRVESVTSTETACITGERFGRDLPPGSDDMSTVKRAATATIAGLIMAGGAAAEDDWYATADFGVAVLGDQTLSYRDGSGGASVSVPTHAPPLH